ncbi:MAG TPA: cyclic nucleotide-binding domain-containing protein [Deltaproteobacteria bacterium]|nr:cyclic nucleotide-binding domain-containing protein [Deltaproteobacteria bacterium]
MVTFNDLRKIFLLENLTDTMLGKMLPFVEMRLFSDGAKIFRQGEKADFFFMLMKGKIVLEMKVSERINVSLGSIKAAGSLGWSALLGDPAYTSDAVCVEPCEIMAIQGGKFQELMERDHDMRYGVMKIVVSLLKRRLERRTDQLLKVIENHPDLQRLFQSD